MTASASANPRSLASSRGNAATRASDTNGGKHSRKSHQTTPRGYVGRTVRLGAPGRPAWKSPTVWAGAAYAAPPASRAARYAARSETPLQRDARQHVVAFQVVGAHVHQQGAVGVFAVARETAHAVRAHAAFLAGGGDHRAARAHAERVDAAPVRQMDGQPVVGRSKRGVLRCPSVLRLVHLALPMLDAHADRERLALHRDSGRTHQLERVARRMAAGEHHALRGKPLRCAAAHVLQVHGGQQAVFEVQADELGVESAPRRRPPRCALRKARTTPGKQVGADVGLRLPEHFLGRACAHERLQHGGAPAGSSVPVVSLPSEKVPAPPSPNCTFACGSSGPPASNAATAAERSSTHAPRSTTSGRSAASARYSAAEQPGRPSAHHQGARLARLRRRDGQIGHGKRRGRMVRARLHAPRRRIRRGQQPFFLRLVGQGHGERRHEMHVALLARVHAALEHAGFGHIPAWHAERACSGLAHKGVAAGQSRIERQGHVGQFDHRRVPFALAAWPAAAVPAAGLLAAAAPAKRPLAHAQCRL